MTEKCADCKRMIDTDNDTFVIIYRMSDGDEESNEHVCFKCYEKRKGRQ